MGYSIILTLDDTAVRRAGADGLAVLTTGLAEVAGTHSYPTALAPHRAGPWQRVGAWHSSSRAVFELTATGLQVIADNLGGVRLTDVTRSGDDHKQLHDLLEDWFGPFTPQAFSPAITTAQHRRAATSPITVEPGQSPLDAAFGPDTINGSGITSVWCFHADALTGSCDWRLAAQQVLAMVDDRFASSVHIGSVAEALARAGVLVAAGNVPLVFSGGRLCEPSALTGDEAASVAAALGRAEHHGERETGRG